MGGGSITLFHVRGIRIAVDWSWLIVLFLIIFWLTGVYRDLLDESSSSSVPYELAVASAFGFFGSILLHELAHSVVAIKQGLPVKNITLFIFGGVSQISSQRAPSRCTSCLISNTPMCICLIHANRSDTF